MDIVLKRMKYIKSKLIEFDDYIPDREDDRELIWDLIYIHESLISGEVNIQTACRFMIKMTLKYDWKCFVTMDEEVGLGFENQLLDVKNLINNCFEENISIKQLAEAFNTLEDRNVDYIWSLKIGDRIFFKNPEKQHLIGIIGRLYDAYIEKYLI